jgi:hypothetical protein
MREMIMVDENFLCGEIPVKEIIEKNDLESEVRVSTRNSSFSGIRRIELFYAPKGRDNPGPCRFVFATEDVPLAFVALGKFLRANGMELPK